MYKYTYLAIHSTAQIGLCVDTLAQKCFQVLVGTLVLTVYLAWTADHEMHMRDWIDMLSADFQSLPLSCTDA